MADFRQVGLVYSTVLDCQMGALGMTLHVERYLWHYYSSVQSMMWSLPCLYSVPSLPVLRIIHTIYTWYELLD